jgi:hypothetical protein
MRQLKGNIWILAVTFAVVTTVASCFGNQAPKSPESSPSRASTKAETDAAYTQYEEGRKPFCSRAYYDLTRECQFGNIARMHDSARTYRHMVAAWDAHLNTISFPPAAQPIVDKIHELNRVELADLDKLAGFVDEPETNLLQGLLNALAFHQSAMKVAGNDLRAALGHPESQSRLAADQLDLAHRTLYMDAAPAGPRFEAALSNNDLNEAKAANAIEQDALQRYIDRLDTIEWPPGFEDQVNTLRNNLRAAIEFDRRQVDVATAAEVVRAPAAGAPEAIAVKNAAALLYHPLEKLANQSHQPPKR